MYPWVCTEQAELTRDTCLSRTPQRIYIQRMHRDCARILLSEFYICPIYVLTCRINIHTARKRRLLIYPTIPEGRGRAAIARWALASL